MLRNVAQPQSVRTVRMPETTGTEWVDIGYAAEKTGFDEVTIRRLIESGDFPAMQLAGSARTYHKIPRRLVDEAYATVMGGGQVELREFCRNWKARNAAPEAVALWPSP